MGEAKTSKEEKTARRAQVLRLRARGIAVGAIAEQLNIDRSTVYRDIEKGLADTVKQAAETVLALELMRLDEYQDGVHDDAKGGDPKAVGAALKIMDHRAKLLGLYKVTDPDAEARQQAGSVVDQLMAGFQKVYEQMEAEDAAGEAA